MSKFLPIGTICKINSSNSLFMITGYFAYCYNNQIEKYDYFACEYPFGVSFISNILGFNHSEIKEIISMGFSNSAYEKLIDELQEYNMSNPVRSKQTDVKFIFDSNGVVTDVETPSSYEKITSGYSVNQDNSEQIKESYKFDKDGNVIQNNNNQTKESYKFDKDGNVIQNNNNQTKESYKFDKDGNVIQNNNSQTKESYKFDKDGNVIQNNNNQTKESYKFDKDGNVIQNINSSENKKISLKFDENGFVVAE